MEDLKFYPIIVRLLNGHFVAMVVPRTTEPRPEDIPKMKEFQATMADDWCCGTVRQTKAEAEAVFATNQAPWSICKDPPKYVYHELTRG